eukprot:558554-Rhodomonas_salina.1
MPETAARRTSKPGSHTTRSVALAGTDPAGTARPCSTPPSSGSYPVPFCSESVPVTQVATASVAVAAPSIEYPSSHSTRTVSLTATPPHGNT